MNTSFSWAIGRLIIIRDHKPEDLKHLSSVREDKCLFEIQKCAYQKDACLKTLATIQ